MTHKQKSDQPLFIWQKLTGRAIFEAMPHGKPWEDLLEQSRETFDKASRTLNMQLSLCSDCGERAQLGADGICQSCEEEHEELARLASRELRVSQTFPSEFTCEEAYEAWREAND